jgi:hypothetical protein
MEWLMMILVLLMDSELWTSILGWLGLGGG